MSIPLLLIELVAIVVSAYVLHSLRIVMKVQRDSLPTNHPGYRPLTPRERRRIGWPPYADDPDPDPEEWLLE